MSDKTKKRPILKIAVILAFFLVLGFIGLRMDFVTNRNNLRHLIVATGTIEATEVDIAAEIGGRILELAVKEGDHVKRGALIAQLDTSLLEAEVLRARGLLESARSALRDLEAGARTQELSQARARVELAKAKMALDEAEWRRARDLHKEGVASQHQLDSAVANRDVSRGQYAVAVEELKLLEAGSRPDRIDAARAEVEQAEAALRLSEVRLEKARITAPLSGVVLVKNAEQGEVMSPGVPIVTVADLDDMWVKIYIDEVDIGKLKVGQQAVVRVDAFPARPFTGHITYIADEAEFTPKNIQTREDRVKLVFAVKVGIDNAGGLLKPGMYGDIELDSLSPGSQTQRQL